MLFFPYNKSEYSVALPKFSYEVHQATNQHMLLKNNKNPYVYDSCLSSSRSTVSIFVAVKYLASLLNFYK